MTDRELLELAAKAAGIKKVRVKTHVGEKEYYPALAYDTMSHKEFNPLDHDGDALRLAVLLRFTIKIADHEIEIFDMDGECLVSIPVFDQDIENVSGMVRRAIVRAAAEIGKQK